MQQPWTETPVLEEDWAESEEEEFLTEEETESEEEEFALEAEELEYEEEEEWPNPFAVKTGEAWTEVEEQEDWTSPFEATELGEEWEAKAAPSTTGSVCFVDKQAPGPRWQHRPKTPVTPGKFSVERFPRNEIIELKLEDFRVNDFRLMADHRSSLDTLAKEIKGKLANGTYVGVVRARVTGSTSSTASVAHNLTLAEHRAYNVAQTLHCLIGGDPKQLDIAWNAVGEQMSARITGQNVETPRFRGVMVRVMAPIVCPRCKEPGPCRCPQPPTHRPPPITGQPPAVGRTTTLCVSVPRIEPRRSGGVPPDVIPLSTVIPGLPLPVALVTKARAQIKVDNQIQRRSAMYDLRGWGLEVALPSSGRVTVDLRSRLQATLDVLTRASASLAGRLNLGPMGLVLRLDASAFSGLVVKLVGELRVQLSLAFAPRPVPELTGCTRVVASSIGGAFSSQFLSGPATLVVPGRGLGPAQLRLSSSRLRLNPNPVALAADKSTVKTVLLIGGDLQLAGAGVSREDEAYFLEAAEEWEADLASETEAELVRGV